MYVERKHYNIPLETIFVNIVEVHMTKQRNADGWIAIHGYRIPNHFLNGTMKVAKKKQVNILTNLNSKNIHMVLIKVHLRMGG